MRPFERLIAKLKGVKRSGPGFMACCPAHDDKNPSLSVNEGQNGRVLLNCFAGCSLDAICAGLGLSKADLFENQGRRALPGQGSPKRRAGGRKIVAVYPYCDEDGAILYERVRYEPKEFRFRRPKPGGGYINDLRGVRRVLYRLPEVVAAKQMNRLIILVEGEKDADALVKLGYVATTCGSAEDWRPEFAKVLAGGRLLIIPDNDAAGYALMNKAMEGHRPSTPHLCFASVAVFGLTDMPAGSDISDWLERERKQGRSDDEIREKLEDMFRLWAVSRWGAEEELKQLQDSGELEEIMREAKAQAAAEAQSEDAPRPKLIVQEAGDIKPEPVEWVWPGKIPLGTVTLLDGEPGVGKSTLMAALAAHVTTGKPFPDGAPCEPGGVLILGAEDQAGVLRARLDAAGAEGGRWAIVSHVEAGSSGWPFRYPEDLRHLREEVQSRGVRLVWVDALNNILPAKTDTNSDAAMRRALAPLNEFARENGVAVVAIRHICKETRRAIYAGLGSVAYVGVARSVLMLHNDPADESRRVLTWVKGNYAAPWKSLRARLVRDEAQGVGRLDWEGEDSRRADDLIAEATDAFAGGGPRARAKDFLRALLFQGELWAETVEAEAAGFRVSRATLYRAKEELGVLSRCEGSGQGRKVYWRLPENPGERLAA